MNLHKWGVESVNNEKEDFLSGQKMILPGLNTHVHTQGTCREDERGETTKSLQPKCCIKWGHRHKPGLILKQPNSLRHFEKKCPAPSHELAVCADGAWIEFEHAWLLCCCWTTVPHPWATVWINLQQNVNKGRLLSLSLSVCVCVCLMNCVMLDNGDLSIWTWLIIQFSSFIPFWWVIYKPVYVGLCRIDCAARNEAQRLSSMYSTSVQTSYRHVHCIFIYIWNVAQHHPSDEADKCTCSQSLHTFDNGVHMQVCMNLHMHGGVHKRWREADVKERSGSEHHSEHSEQNTDNNMNTEYEYRHSLNLLSAEACGWIPIGSLLRLEQAALHTMPTLVFSLAQTIFPCLGLLICRLRFLKGVFIRSAMCRQTSQSLEKTIRSRVTGIFPFISEEHSKDCPLEDAGGYRLQKAAVESILSFGGRDCQKSPSNRRKPSLGKNYFWRVINH